MKDLSKEDQAQLGEMDTLIQSFITIGNKMKDQKIDPSDAYHYNAEGLGKKVLHHIISLRILFNSYQYQAYESQVDFSSIAVLTRAALETYLTLHYLFIAPRTEDERVFKMQSWYLGGLDRVKFKPAFDKNVEKWEKENQSAMSIKAKIQNTDYFKQLHPENQKKVLKGQWNLRPWYEMAVGAGFSETHFRKIYSFLSAYAHSNRLSIIQMQQISTISEQRQFSLAFIGIAMTVLGKYAYDYIYLIPGLQQKVDMNSADYKLILQYKQIAEML